MSDGFPPSVSREFGFFGLRLVQFGVLFASTIVVARVLGPVGRTEYALPFALSGAVWVVIGLSADSAAGRIIGRGDADIADLVGALAACLVAMAFVGITATLLLGTLGDGVLVGDAPAQVVLVAALSIPGLLMTQVSGYLLLLLRRIRAYAWAAVIAAAVQFAVVVVLVAADALNPVGAAVATTAGFSASGVLMSAALLRQVGYAPLRHRPRSDVVRRLLRSGSAIHPMSITLQLGSRLELLVVGLLTTARNTGLYSLALTLAQVPLFASLALAQSGVGPISEGSEENAVQYGCEFTRQVGLVAVALAGVGCLLAYPLVETLYGPAWQSTVVPLVILLLGTVALGIESPLRVLLLRVAPPVHMAGVAVVALALNTVLTVVLILPLGIVGAAIASLIAYVALAAGMVRLLLWAAPDAPLRQAMRRPGSDDWVVGVMRRWLRHPRRMLRP